jgi:hypothetical protein
MSCNRLHAGTSVPTKIHTRETAAGTQLYLPSMKQENQA